MECMLLNHYGLLKSGCECLAHQGQSPRNWPKLYLNLKAFIIRKMHLSHHERNQYGFLTSPRKSGHNPVSNSWIFWCILNLKTLKSFLGLNSFCHLFIVTRAVFQRICDISPTEFSSHVCLCVCRATSKSKLFACALANSFTSCSAQLQNGEPAANQGCLRWGREEDAQGPSFSLPPASKTPNP